MGSSVWAREPDGAGQAAPAPAPAEPRLAESAPPAAPAIEAAVQELAQMGIDLSRYRLGAPPRVAPPRVGSPPAPYPEGAPPNAVPAELPAQQPARPARVRGVASVPSGPYGTPVPPPATGLSGPPASAPASAVAHVLEGLAPLATPEPPGVPELSRRVLRAVAQGVLSPRTAAVIDHERALVAAIRARRQHPEVVAVLAGKGGVGTTTTAAGLGLTLAALRTDQTRLVDARCGTNSLGLRLAGQPASTAADLLAAHDAGRPATPLSVRGLQIVEGARWYEPAARDRLVRLLLIGASTATTLLDIGNDTGDIAHLALGRANRIIVATTAGQDALEATRVAFGRIYQIDPALVDRAVVAVVCLTRRWYRGVLRTLRSELGVAAARVVPVPHDPALATGGVFDVDRLRPATREAYLELAARISQPGY